MHQKYGFPDIDPPLSWSRGTLIDHIDNYANFKKIDKYLLDAVNKGIYGPAHYAYAMDRSLIASGLKPKYYWLIPETPWAEKYKPGQKELAKVNHDRWLIGLPAYPMWTGWGF